MMRLALLLTLTTVVCYLSGASGLAAPKRNPMSLARRAFLVKIPASVAVLTMGQLLLNNLNADSNINNNDNHSPACNCENCASKNRFPLLQPLSASAYEARPVGGDNPSATIAAYNIQSQKTYDRLEKEGYKLDTREEEAARLSDALASFSYPSSSSSKDSKKDGKKTFSNPKSSKAI